VYSGSYWYPKQEFSSISKSLSEDDIEFKHYDENYIAEVWSNLSEQNCSRNCIYTCISFMHTKDLEEELQILLPWGKYFYFDVIIVLKILDLLQFSFQYLILYKIFLLHLCLYFVCVYRILNIFFIFFSRSLI
jgi:hypothetical protein